MEDLFSVFEKTRSDQINKFVKFVFILESSLTLHVLIDEKHYIETSKTNCKIRLWCIQVYLRIFPKTWKIPLPNRTRRYRRLLRPTYTKAIVTKKSWKLKLHFLTMSTFMVKSAPILPRSSARLSLFKGIEVPLSHESYR